MRRPAPKRLLDLLVSAAMTPFAVVVCLLVAVPIWLECRASPFFWQLRLGHKERQFKILKLRTMHPDTRQAGSHEVGQDAVLRVGRLVRGLKIDELPQLWNVLRGEMSLVGPRPGLIVQEELAEARRHYGVFDLLPGITGISQVRRIDMSTPWELAKLDATYATPWKLKTDLAILLKTVTGAGYGDAAATIGKGA